MAKTASLWFWAILLGFGLGALPVAVADASSKPWQIEGLQTALRDSQPRVCLWALQEASAHWERQDLDNLEDRIGKNQDGARFAGQLLPAALECMQNHLVQHQGAPPQQEVREAIAAFLSHTALHLRPALQKLHTATQAPQRRVLMLALLDLISPKHRAWEGIIASMLQDPDPQIQQDAKKTRDLCMRRLGVAASELKDRHPKTRLQAAKDLVQLGSLVRHVQEDLLKALQDREQYVRDQAALALAQTGPSAQVAARIAQALTSQNVDRVISSQAGTEALSKMDGFLVPLLPALAKAAYATRNPDETDDIANLIASAGKHARAIVPEVLVVLRSCRAIGPNERNPQVISTTNIVHVLSALGVEARLALPYIKKIAQDNDQGNLTCTYGGDLIDTWSDIHFHIQNIEGWASFDAVKGLQSESIPLQSKAEEILKRTRYKANGSTIKRLLKLARNPKAKFYIRLFAVDVLAANNIPLVSNLLPDAIAGDEYKRSQAVQLLFKTRQAILPVLPQMQAGLPGRSFCPHFLGGLRERPKWILSHDKEPALVSALELCLKAKITRQRDEALRLQKDIQAARDSPATYVHTRLAAQPLDEIIHELDHNSVDVWLALAEASMQRGEPVTDFLPYLLKILSTPSKQRQTRALELLTELVPHLKGDARARLAIALLPLLDKRSAEEGKRALEIIRQLKHPIASATLAAMSEGQ